MGQLLCDLQPAHEREIAISGTGPAVEQAYTLQPAFTEPAPNCPPRHACHSRCLGDSGQGLGYVEIEGKRWFTYLVTRRIAVQLGVRHHHNFH